MIFKDLGSRGVKISPFSISLLVLTWEVFYLASFTLVFLYTMIFLDFLLVLLPVDEDAGSPSFPFCSGG
jgi:hypothetical protein